MIRISHKHAMRMSATRDDQEESKLLEDIVEYQSDAGGQESKTDLISPRDRQVKSGGKDGNTDSAVTKKLTGSNIFGRGSRNSHRQGPVPPTQALKTTLVDKVSIEKLEKDFERRCQLILRSKKFEEEDWDNLENLSKEFL